MPSELATLALGDGETLVLTADVVVVDAVVDEAFELTTCGLV